MPDGSLFPIRLTATSASAGTAAYAFPSDPWGQGIAAGLVVGFHAVDEATGAWEAGRGTRQANGTITRDLIYRRSDSGSGPVAWPAGARFVSITVLGQVANPALPAQPYVELALDAAARAEQARAETAALLPGEVAAREAAIAAEAQARQDGDAAGAQALAAETQARTDGDAARLVKALNLADLPSPLLARSNLGLGSAATRNIGVGAGTAMAGDDQRVLDAAAHGARADNPHGTTAGQVGAYTKGETDSLLGGKAPAAHTHAASEIRDGSTVGRALLTALDSAAQRTALGLGNAATKNTGTGPGDVASGDVGAAATAHAARTDNPHGTSAGQVPFVAAGTGAVSRDVQAKVREAVSQDDYYAPGSTQVVTIPAPLGEPVFVINPGGAAYNAPIGATIFEISTEGLTVHQPGGPLLVPGAGASLTGTIKRRTTDLTFGGWGNWINERSDTIDNFSLKSGAYRTGIAETGFVDANFALRGATNGTLLVFNDDDCRAEMHVAEGGGGSAGLFYRRWSLVNGLPVWSGWRQLGWGWLMNGDVAISANVNFDTARPPGLEWQNAPATTDFVTPTFRGVFERFGNSRETRALQRAIPAARPHQPYIRFRDNGLDDPLAGTATWGPWRSAAHAVASARAQAAFDANAIVEPGLHDLDSGVATPTNCPGGGPFNGRFEVTSDITAAGNLVQTAFRWGAPDTLWRRVRVSNVWSAWRSLTFS